MDVNYACVEHCSADKGNNLIILCYRVDAALLQGPLCYKGPCVNSCFNGLLTACEGSAY